ncbi:hypothetical Protein YC6258_03132 [Gynuella sunshinyii YC6258]|uniref:Uncharacterized protein n=1 Tax=Gynuella sunshinyii YC6258 TaxID=1445510 RepID=A0A0C5VP49_9GAMM|nr:hypothetical Protein YC6258_03132 [Gynuella sunshinyii YC6258]
MVNPIGKQRHPAADDNKVMQATNQTVDSLTVNATQALTPEQLSTKKLTQ